MQLDESKLRIVFNVFYREICFWQLLIALVFFLPFMFVILMFSLTEEKLVLLRPLENITLNDVGLTATFECEISIAGLKSDWTKGSKVLKPDGKNSIITDGKIHRLTINEATGEDEGQYTVNFSGKNLNSTAKLLVKGNGDYTHPALFSSNTCNLVRHQTIAIIR